MGIFFELTQLLGESIKLARDEKIYLILPAIATVVLHTISGITQEQLGVILLDTGGALPNQLAIPVGIPIEDVVEYNFDGKRKI